MIKYICGLNLYRIFINSQGKTSGNTKTKTKKMTGVCNQEQE